MLDVVVNALQGDGTLAGLLTGGIYDGGAVDAISRQETPDAYDANLELLPCALVRAESATPWGPICDAGRLYFVVWMYQRSGAATIEAARLRIYTLLHRQQLSTTDGIYRIDHANDLLGLDEAPLSAKAVMSRFVATIGRE